MKLVGLMQRAEQVLFSSSVTEVMAHSSKRGSVALAKANLTLTQKPRSILNFKSLFDNRTDVINKYMAKLKDSGHPIIGIASELCIENPTLNSFSSSLQLRAILVLLVSKSFGFSSTLKYSSKEIQEEVEAKQFAIAEIAELIYTAHILHRTITNTLDPSSPLHHGNKLAVLTGDLLLAKSSRHLSDLKNNKVTELMTRSICDFSESEFIGAKTNNVFLEKTKLNNNDISQQFSYSAWLKRAELSLGSLLGYACLCSAIIAGHDGAVQKFAFHLGKQVGLTLQAYKDIKVFEDESRTKKKMSHARFFDLLNLPVIFEVEKIPALVSIETLDLQMIFDKVQSSPTAIPRARESLIRIQLDSIRLLRQIEPKTSTTEVLSEILESFSS